MANIRFLYDNKLDTTGAVITASSTVAAQISQAQKNGTGSGSCVPGGTYTGTTERTYLIIIDTAGDVGAAIFKWSSDGGSTFSAVLVATASTPITLDNGITVYFMAGTGTDFVLGDRWDFKVLFGYGTAKLTDRNRNTEWRSADVTGAKTITLGLAAPLAIQACLLWDHNLTNAATITLAAHTADAWGAPDFGPVGITWASAKIAYYLTATQTYRYWQLSITDAANPDGYLRISNLFLGPYTAMTQNFAYGWSRGRMPYMAGNIIGLHPDAVVLGLPELLMCNFPLLPDADRDALVDTIFPALYSVSTKRVRPCWIHPDPSVANDAIMGYWENEALSVYAETPNSYWNLPLQFRELVRAMV